METTGEKAAEPGLTPERVGMFADAVLAIAITLLAIELPRPDEAALVTPAAFAHFLGEEAGSFFAFVLAFAMLWWIWRTHHALIDHTAAMSPLGMLLHLPLLLLAVWMPYVTSVFGEADRNALVTALFSGTEGIMMCCLGALFAVVLGQRLYRTGTDRTRLRVSALVHGAIGLWWIGAGLVAFATAQAPWLWVATPPIAYGTARLARRFLPPPAPA